MKIQIWRRRNKANTKYNLYLRYRINQNKAKVESLKLWEWIEASEETKILHNKSVETAYQEILRRTKDDIENKRIHISFENKSQKLKNDFIKYSKLKNKIAVFTFIYNQDNQVNNIITSEVNYDYLSKLKFTIESNILEKKIKNSTASKYWSDFKKGLKELNKKNLCEYPKVPGINYKKEKTKKLVFDKTQITKIKKCKTKNKEIKKAFLFSCLTGAKFKILKELHWINIKKIKENRYYIEININNNEFVIPFDDEARKLLGTRKEEKKNVFKLKNKKNNISKIFYNLMLESNNNTEKKFKDGINTYAINTYKKTKNIYLISSTLGHNSIEKTKKEYQYMNEKDYIEQLFNINKETKSKNTENKHKKLFKRGNLLSYKKDTF